MTELTQTKEVCGAVFEVLRTAQQIREGGVQAHEITDGLADGPIKDALNKAIEGADLVGPELRSVAAGDWRAGADLFAYLAEQAQTLESR